MEVRSDAALAQRLSSPNPFALITSTDGKKTNVMALSWWTYCSNHPLTVAICVGQNSYSRQCISVSKQFCLCLPGERIAAAAFAAGTCTGADRDKVKELGLELTHASVVMPDYITESRLVLECEVQRVLKINDHHMFVAAVLAAHANESLGNLMALDGYKKLGSVSVREKE